MDLTRWEGFRGRGEGYDRLGTRDGRRNAKSKMRCKERCLLGHGKVGMDPENKEKQEASAIKGS